MAVSRSIFRRKSVEDSLEESLDPERALRRTLTTWDLIVLGVAVAVGAGIFSVGATAAANYAGPAVIVSFLIASVVCGLAIMCYAEFASTLPVAGSAYTFSYASMGEFVAWIIGWDLILEMLLGSAVIAKFWGVYLSDAFGLFGIDVPTTLTPRAACDVEWGPVVIVAVFTTLLALGTKLSTRVNSVFTIIKVAITLFVIVVGFFYVNTANYSPFVPPSQPAPERTSLEQPVFAFLFGLEPTAYGVIGVLSGAALVFFAFIGFDVVATTAEETKEPQRTVPRGILGGLAIVTVLYVLVTIVVTGMVSYTELAEADTPVADHGVRAGRRGLGGHGDLRGDPGGPHVGAHGAAAGPDADRLRHEPRRAAAPGRVADVPEVRHPGPAADRRRRRRRADRRAVRGGAARGDDQHRDAVGVRAGQLRHPDPAPDAPGPAARLPGAVVAGAADHRRASRACG